MMQRSISAATNDHLERVSSSGTTGTLTADVVPPSHALVQHPIEERRSAPPQLGERRSSSGVFGYRRNLSRISFRTDAGGQLLNRYRQTRFSSRRVRKRVVFKHGDCNVVQGNVAKRRRRYLQDIFTTLVDAQWRWTLMVFAMTFLLSWLGFALVWWLIVYAHGDLDPTRFEDPDSNVTYVPCVEDIHGFTSCFLFSVETQHTIGYGSKHTTEECPEAIFIMCIQSMTGVILQAFMVGIVFAKLSRPKKRTQTLLFSRNAVICLRDGQPCLMFRVGDMRKSHIIEAHVRAQMIKRKVTREGELLPFFQTELKVGADGDEDKILFIWPTTIVHKINEQSPLYHLSASDMLRERFEIIVLLEGVIESTGMTTQARSSYLPSEILWGHRFEHIITFRKETGEYEVNYTLFNNTYEVDTPLCSAAELDHVRAMHRAKGERTSSATFAQYRDDSSSSLSSGSSFSSVGGLQMHAHAATPPTPIPVMITAPEDSPSRRGSSSLPPEPRRKFATFYTLDETIEPNEPPYLRSQPYPEELANVEEEEEHDPTAALLGENPTTPIIVPETAKVPNNDTAEYDKALENINASLRNNRQAHQKSAMKTSENSLASLRNDSKTSIEDTRNSHHGKTGGLGKSPSHVTLVETRESSSKQSNPSISRQSSEGDGSGSNNHRSNLSGHKHHHHHHHGHHQDSPKKTSFQLVAPEVTLQEATPPPAANCNRPKEIV